MASPVSIVFNHDAGYDLVWMQLCGATHEWTRHSNSYGD